MSTMPATMHESVHTGKHRLLVIRALPTSGALAHDWGVNTRETAAANLRELMAAARRRGDRDLASDKALSAKTGLGRPTIEGLRKGLRAVGIDTLEIVANAYDLQAWQMLVPGLDPENAPTLPVTETERELWKSVTESLRKSRARERADASEGPGSSHVGDDRTRTARRSPLAENGKK